MNKLGMKGRKWDIFVSAVYLFAENGYDNVSLKNLAEKNYIQASAIYNHFKSKDELLQTMYAFYYANWQTAFPVLDDVLKAVPSADLQQLVQTFIIHYSEELQPLMENIIFVASKMTSDERAYDLIQKVLFVEPGNFLRIILGELITLNRIEELDVEAFITVFTNMAYSASVFNRTKDAVTRDEWVHAMNLIYSLLQQIEA